MFKKELKKALKLAGLPEGLASIINVTTVAEIPAAIAQLQNVRAADGDDDDEPTITPEEFIGSKAFTDFVEKNGFDKLLELNAKVQSGHDKKVSQGIKTALTKALGEDGSDPGTPPATPPTPPTDDMPAWAKAIMQKVDNIEKKGQTESKLEKVKEALKKSRIPSKLQGLWANRIDPESEKSIDDQISDLETEYKTAHAIAIGQETYEFPNEPDNGGKPPKKGPSEAELKKIQEMAAKL